MQRPAIVLLVVVLIALGAATAVTKLLAHASGSPPATPAASGRPSSCADLVVPAYFDDMSDWPITICGGCDPTGMHTAPSTGDT